MTSQRRRVNVDAVDSSLSSGSEVRRVFRAAAYSMGLGMGLLLFNPVILGIENEDAMQIMNALHVFAYFLIGSALCLGATFLFFKSKMRLVRFTCGWIVTPVVLLWTIVSVSGVFSK